VKSTIYPFPKVIWNGSHWVDYFFNASDMSVGMHACNRYDWVVNNHVNGAKTLFVSSMIRFINENLCNISCILN